MMYIFCSISQVILHDRLGPAEIISKIAMTIVIILSMGKTFFFLRIFSKLSPIITMITKVMKDLQVFMFFFLILILKFSLIVDIMGIGNVNIDGPFKDKFEGESEYPGSEFSRIGLFVGNFF